MSSPSYLRPNPFRKCLKSGLLFALATVLLAHFGLHLVETYYNPKKIEALISKELRRSKWFQENKSAELKVAVEKSEIQVSGLWPRLSVVLGGLDLELEVACLPKVQWQLDEIRLPILWASLAAQQVRLGQVEVHRSHFYIEEILSGENCKKSAALPANFPKAPLFNVKKNQERTLAQTSPVAKREVKKVKPLLPMDSLQVKNFFVHWQGHELQLNQADFRWQPIEKSFEAFGDVQWNISPKGWSSTLPKLQTSLIWDGKRLEHLTNGQWREGTLKLDGLWIKETDIDKLALQLKNLPLKSVLDLIQEINPDFLAGANLLSSSWLSCELETEVIKAQVGPVEMSQCRLHGEMGEVEIEAAQVEWDAKKKSLSTSPFKAQLKKWDLEKTLQVFSVTSLDRVLAQYGQLNGEVEVEWPKSANFIGEVKELALAFSSKGVRGKQPIDNLAGEFKWTPKGVKGRIDQILFPSIDVEETEERQSLGDIRFQFAEDLTKGKIQAEVHHMSFDPSIQKLLIGGEISPLSLTANMVVRDGEISNWQGKLNIAELKTETEEVQKLEVQSSVKKKKIVLKTKAAKGLLKKNSPYYQKHQELFADYPEDDVQWQNLRFQLEVGEEQTTWRRSSVRLKPGIALNSWGQRSVKGELSGTLDWRAKGQSKVRWKLGGNEATPTWERTVTLRRPAKKNKN